MATTWGTTEGSGAVTASNGFCSVLWNERKLAVWGHLQRKRDKAAARPPYAEGAGIWDICVLGLTTCERRCGLGAVCVSGSPREDVLDEFRGVYL